MNWALDVLNTALKGKKTTPRQKKTRRRQKGLKQDQRNGAKRGTTYVGRPMSERKKGGCGGRNFREGRRRSCQTPGTAIQNRRQDAEK